MAYKSLRMEKIKRIQKYHKKGVPKKKIARLLGLSKNTVKKYILLLESQEFDDEDELSNARQKKEFPEGFEVLREHIFQEYLPKIITELGRVGVTRSLLWQEYKKNHHDGFSYSRFCRKIAAYKARQNVTIRVDHKAAHTISVDFAGKKVEWIERKTGEIKYAEVLVLLNTRRRLNAPTRRGAGDRGDADRR